MSAEKVTWDKNLREKLSEVLPLITPLSLNIEASRACNIKCIYCVHSLSSEKLYNMDFKPNVMDLNTYFKIVNDCKKFNKKIKTIRFAGYGEPLMNKNLSKMIAYTKKSDVCEQVVVFTNALLLNKEVAKDLIDAGTDVLRITIQGLSEEAYLKNTSVRIDFEVLLSNLKYLFKIRNNCKIFLKTMNFSVKNEEDLFFNMFEDVCDEIAIENVTEVNKDIDYTDIIPKDNNLIVTGEHKMSKVNICPYPFYMMTINADGNVSACCKAIDKVFFVGNINNESLYSIWNNKKNNNLRNFHLKNTRFKHGICKNCDSLNYAVPVSDLIDDQADRLLKIYVKK